jgi:hypothetical protein
MTRRLEAKQTSSIAAGEEIAARKNVHVFMFGLSAEGRDLPTSPRPSQSLLNYSTNMWGS